MFTQPGVFIKNEALSGSILVQEAGYVSISEELYEDSKITFSFPAPSSKLVLIPKYLNDNNFLFVSIDNTNLLHIGGIVKGSEKIYGEVLVDPLDADNNSLSVVSYGTQFTILLNQKIVFKFESALFLKGQVRLYGEAGENFYSITVEEPQSSRWMTNGGSNRVEIKLQEFEERNQVKLKGSEANSAQIHQSFHFNVSNLTLSFNAIGSGKYYLKDEGGSISHLGDIATDEITRISVLLEINVAGTYDLYFETNQQLSIGEVQIESRVSETGYISNPSATEPAYRMNSTLSYPLKDDFPAQSGSLYIKLSTINDFKEAAVIEKKQMIFRTNDNQLRLDYQNGNLMFTAGAETISYPILFSALTNIELIARWDGTKMDLSVNGETVSSQNAGIINPKITQLIFAEEGSVQEPIILEEWALFHNQISKEEDINKLLPQAIMQSLFEGGISGHNVTWAEIPVAPIDHSPILVQKDTGETLQKVSFFNFQTGQYETWNQEPFVYDGKSDFVDVSYTNLNEEFRDISIRTEEGEKIAEPYRVDGKRFNFSLSSNEKWLYKNKTLYATYQVNDTYTIDYNIKAADGYRINFAKHDGGKRVVYQEGNRYGDIKKLATMIDMNPIQNQNHDGFLYVTNTVNKTDSFRITATPDRLHADGSSYSTLIIEPLDYQGNFLSHSNLRVVADKGFICRHVSKDAVEAQKRSGQYLYQYYSPYIKSNNTGELIEDYIWIIDQDNDIGIGYKMILSPSNEPSPNQLTKQEKETLSEKTEIINYLLMYEGIEQYEDQTLLSILDLNKDGRVTMEEIQILETNQRDQELTLIINKLREWEAAANGITTT